MANKMIVKPVWLPKNNYKKKKTNKKTVKICTDKSGIHTAQFFFCFFEFSRNSATHR